MFSSKNKFQSISGVLLIILGIAAIALAIVITPIFATNYLSPDHNIATEGIKELYIYRFISFFSGVLLIISGTVLMTVKNLDLTFLQKNKKKLFFFLFIAAHIFILRNVILLSRDMLYGDFSAEKIFPSPIYGFMRIPDSPLARLHNAQNKLAADFASTYFPSQQMDSLNENYQTGALDPWHRPSRSAPLVHFLCSITFCRLDYGIASILHISTQYVLFLIAFIISFKLLNIEEYFLPGLLLANIYLFLTPAGLSWFERGQFYLFVGTGYLLIIIGFIKRNNLLILISALFAFMRWPSFPFFLVIFATYLFNSKNLAEVKRTILLGAAFVFIILALTFSLPEQSLYFLKGLYDQEGSYVPAGISLAMILPVTITKFLPIPLIILGALTVTINKKVFERNIPFLAGSAILLLTYSTAAYIYNLPSLLCFVPLFYYWTKLPNYPIHSQVREIMKYSLFAFVFLASFLNSIMGKFTIIEFFLISFILLMVPFYYHWKYPLTPERSQKSTI
jgi:hypothetical protein